MTIYAQCVFQFPQLFIYVHNIVVEPRGTHWSRRNPSQATPPPPVTISAGAWKDIPGKGPLFFVVWITTVVFSWFLSSCNLQYWKIRGPINDDTLSLLRGSNQRSDTKMIFFIRFKKYLALCSQMNKVQWLFDRLILRLQNDLHTLDSCSLLNQSCHHAISGGGVSYFRCTVTYLHVHDVYFPISSDTSEKVLANNFTSG